MNERILPTRLRSWLRRRSRNWVMFVAIALLVLTMSALIRISVMAQEPTSGAVGIHKVQGGNWSPGMGQPLFIAVMGSDARSGPPNAGGGCDAIHIVAINPQQKAGTILNFPRDSYLEGRKITDTCRTAGFSGAAAVLKRHTGIPIQYLVRTEFSHFRSLISDLGGIVVNVPYSMSDPPSGAFFGPGPNMMNGDQALAFTRNRKSTPNGDFSRTENQGIFMLAALQKFRADAADPHKILDYVRAGRKHVSSDVGVVDLLRLAFMAKEIDPAAIKNVTIPGSTGSAGAASVVFVAPGDIYDRVRDDAIY